MGRPRKFCRHDVLERALPLFWSNGFGATAVQDLERTTGVNKSGLYAEFAGKEEMFLASLRHYFDSVPPAAVLLHQPLGWANIEKLFKDAAITCTAERRGCFAVNTLRELPHLPPAAQDMVAASRAALKDSLARNIAAEETRLAPQAIAELAATLYSGFCIELHLKTPKAALQRRIDELMSALKAL